MKDDTKAPYDLWYWPSIQGRGEFVRVFLAAADIRWRDRARDADAQALIEDMEARAEDGFAPYAPPYLVERETGFAIAQVAHIVTWLAEKHGRFLLRGALLRALAVARNAVVGKRSMGMLALETAAMIAHHPARDRKEPRLDAGAAFELGELAMHDDEHLLSDVVDCAVRNAQTPRRTPDEVEVLLVNLRERVLLADGSHPSPRGGGGHLGGCQHRFGVVPHARFRHSVYRTQASRVIV